MIFVETIKSTLRYKGFVSKPLRTAAQNKQLGSKAQNRINRTKRTKDGTLVKQCEVKKVGLQRRLVRNP